MGETNAAPNVAISSDDIAVVENSAITLAGKGALDVLDLLSVVDRLVAAGKKDAAKALYQTWLEHTISPYAYLVCFNLAVMVSADGDYAGAEKLNRRALELNPDLFQARLNLGNNLEAQGRQEDALEQWRAVLALKAITLPENKELHLHALNNIGRLLETRRELSESLKVLEQSLMVEPSQPDVILHAGHLRQKQCIWPLNLFRKAKLKNDMVVGCSPLALLAATNDPELQLEAGRWFVDRKFRAENRRLAPVEGYRHRKTRIGYLSSDFCMHAVSLLTVELFELHDRERFEVYGFCWSREDGTYLRTRVITAMDHFIKIGAMSDAAAAECIRSHEIDILIDLQGLTSGARPLILSYRPAPVQATYLGFPGTTAIPWIDYVIADRYLIPESEACYYSEKPLYLPHCFQVSDSKRPIGAKPTRAANNLPEDAFVFCIFNNNYKFTPELFAAWMRILKKVPGSVLWLLADNEWSRENLIRSAKKHGIKKERLIFASRVVPADYLARYQIADLFLDTFPFNGGTTANDALFMGLPLLTLSGRTFASRMAGSLLTDLGIPEMITTSVEEYEKKAVMYAKNADRLAKVKAKLDDARRNGRTFNIPALVKDYEAALTGALGAQGGPGAVADQMGSAQSSRPKGEPTIMQRPITHGHIQNLVNLIRPWHMADQAKYRVGSDADGGYVLPVCAQRTKLVFSIGIGNEVSFDGYMAGLGAQVLQFDHTIPGAPLQHPCIRYFKQGWGPKDNAEESLLSLKSMMALADWNGVSCPILKFDTEGAEWDSLIATDSGDLARFEILTGEFHDFQNLVNRDYYDKVLAVFTKLAQTHKVVHLHANNAGGFVMVGGMPFPRLLELTYLRNDVSIFTGHSMEPIPGPLDRPNVPQLPDLYLRVF